MDKKKNQECHEDDDDTRLDRQREERKKEFSGTSSNQVERQQEVRFGRSTCLLYVSHRESDKQQKTKQVNVSLVRMGTFFPDFFLIFKPE